MNDFGNTIKELRKAKRLTQREIADILNVDYTYISKIENNKLETPPSEEVIRKLADILEYDAETFLDLAGKLDYRILLDEASKHPTTAILLRRIQSGKVSQEHIEKFLRSIDKEGD